MPINNRWAFSSEVIDNTRINDWIQPLDSDVQVQLKKVKISGLPWQEMLYLMRNLSAVEQLDIEQFEVAQEKTQICDLPSLQTLSILSFRQVTKRKPDRSKADLIRTKGSTTVQFNAPRLSRLHLGKLELCLHFSVRMMNRSLIAAFLLFPAVSRHNLLHQTQPS